MAELLKNPPADLTLLSQKNGGNFPLIDVYQAIDGRRGIRAHGAEDMPLWGNRYRVEAENKLSEMRIPHELNPENIVHGRITSLVYYIQSIQAE
jgi:hypothetical protein